MQNTEILTINYNDFSQDHWNEKESKNVKVVIDFFQHLMNEHDFDYILKNYGSTEYIQHNRAIPDGMQGLVNYIKNLTGRFPEYGFDVKNIIVDGDFVILHSHATLRKDHRGNENKGFIITDTFRLENGNLVEHWDAIQPIDFLSRCIFLITGGEKGNNNSIF